MATLTLISARWQLQPTFLKTRTAGEKEAAGTEIFKKLSNCPTFNKSQPRRGPNVQRLARRSLHPLSHLNKTAQAPCPAGVGPTTRAKLACTGVPAGAFEQKKSSKNKRMSSCCNDDERHIFGFPTKDLDFASTSLILARGDILCLTSCCCSYPAVTSASE